jgi:hypothetical protein
METTKTTDCQAVDDILRRAALDQLQVDVARHEDTFLLDLGDEEGPDYELNHAAVAEWAWGLLERQRAALTEAVMRALDEHHHDDKDEGLR